jgi:ABC-type phosphate transport system substrate-binding protein
MKTDTFVTGWDSMIKAWFLITLAAVAMGIGSFLPRTAQANLFLQCEGASLLSLGSTAQTRAQREVWNRDFNLENNLTACDGTQGDKGTPKVEYLQEPYSEVLGSGACLKLLGVGVTYAKFDRYSFCGTDEPPDEKQKEEIEDFAPKAELPSLETIPVLQVAVTIIVHLPKGCTASAEYTEAERLVKRGRLVLNDTTLEGIYRGKVRTWKELIEAEGGKDKLSCSGGEAEENKRISLPVPREEEGSTHIVKEFLASVGRMNAAGEEDGRSEETWTAEAFRGKPVETRTWLQVASGLENARWPSAAEVEVMEGDAEEQEVISYVKENESSLAYAELSQAYDDRAFTAEGGEKTVKFWAEVQRKTGPVVLYADPADKKDTAVEGNANCKSTTYTKLEAVFPPASTRESWNEVTSKLNSSTYALCGFTYDLALRQYGKYRDEREERNVGPTEGQATTAENYLLFEVNDQNAEGGQRLIANNEYEALPNSLLKEIDTGIEEIGFETSGVKFVCEKQATEGEGTFYYKTQKECETLNAPGSKGFYRR